MIPNRLFWKIITEIQETLADYEDKHGYAPSMWVWVWMEFAYVPANQNWPITQTDFIACAADASMT
jgi:hypothetical protein